MRSSNRAYIFNVSVAFVPFPNASFWVRVHSCVLTVKCPVCRSEPGNLCKNPSTKKLVTYTHYHRRRAAQIQNWNKENVLPSIVMLKRPNAEKREVSRSARRR